MKSIALLVVAFFIATNVQAQEKPFVIGKIEQLHSEILHEDRTLNIYLPQNYEKNNTAFPVIYLMDGSSNEDFLHIVGLVQYMTMIEKMPASIVVGIANVDRKRDFTFPTTIKKDKEDFPTTGSSAKFITFLEKELQPFIEKKYRTGSKTIIGQSLGALLATEILLKKPQLFDNYIIVSPSLWWDNESLLQQAPQLLSAQPDVAHKVYVSVGSEGKVMETDAKNLSATLEAAKKKNLQLFFVPLPEEDHATILHNSVYKAFGLLNAKKT